MLWFVVAAALAQDAPVFIDPSVRVEDASRGHIVVPGEIGVRATVYEMGAQMEDVTLVTAEVRRGVQPPMGSVQDGSGGPWRQVFGRDTLTVRQQRLGGGHLAAEYRSSEASGLDPAWESPADRICASGSRIDARPVDLRTWDEGVRPHAGVTGPGTSMYWVDGGSTRTALVYLAPGDSVTIVEVLDAPRRHPKRRIDVVRDQGHLEIRESDRRQQVCVEG